MIASSQVWLEINPIWLSVLMSSLAAYSRCSGQSPFAMWQNLALAPTSVTELVTEERQQGYACFRGLKIGDVSHLTMIGEPPSFAARFCEVYSDMSQRH